MIASCLLAVVVAAIEPASTPVAAATMPVANLPTIDRALALPYPATGVPQPQVVQTRNVPGVPALISLDQAVAIAIDRVPSLAAARAEVTLEDASVLSQKTALQPDASIAASTTQEYYQTGSGVASASGQSNSATLSLSQLIFDGGQVRAKIEAANLTRDASFATYRRDAQTVAYDVATDYYTVLEQERNVAVDEQLLQEDVVSEKLVRAQIAAGTEAGADLFNQIATTENARTTLVTAQGTLQNDRTAFAGGLGLDADANVLPVDDSQGLDTTTPQNALPAYAVALGIAYVERPDNSEAQLTIASSRASLRAAERGLAPTFKLAAGKGLASADAGGGAYRNNGNIGVDVSIPVYDGGTTHANILSSKASLAIATADADTTVLTVQQDVRQALISIVSDRATLDSTRSAYTSGVQALRSTQGQYRVGVATLPQLIQAEATLASSAASFVNAIYTLRLSQSNLQYALGTNLQ